MTANLIPDNRVDALLTQRVGLSYAIPLLPLYFLVGPDGYIAWHVCQILRLGVNHYRLCAVYFTPF